MEYFFSITGLSPAVCTSLEQAMVVALQQVLVPV